MKYVTMILIIGFGIPFLVYVSVMVLYLIYELWSLMFKAIFYGIKSILK